jgi:hypothetical protein
VTYFTHMDHARFIQSCRSHLERHSYAIPNTLHDFVVFWKPHPTSNAIDGVAMRDDAGIDNRLLVSTTNHFPPDNDFTIGHGGVP